MSYSKRKCLALFATIASSPATAEYCTTVEDSLWLILKEAPDTLHYNWYRAAADRAHGATQGLLEPLFAVDPATREVVPWLARTQSMTGATTVEISLRSRVKWSDGVSFTAEDVRFSLQTVLDNEALDGPGIAALRDAVVSVAAPTNNRVVIELATPDPEFVRKFLTAEEDDAFPIVPKHVWQDVDPVTFDNETPLGTGPYVYSGDLGDWPDWTLNEAWWGKGQRFPDLPAPARIDWTVVGRAEDDVRALTRGCADILTGVSPGLAEGVVAVAPFVTVLSHAGIGPVDLYSRARWEGWGRLPEFSTDALLDHRARWLIHALRAQ